MKDAAESLSQRRKAASNARYWVNKRGQRLIVQGITDGKGTYHAKGCQEYGTKVVGGVTPGKGGRSMKAGRCSTPWKRRERDGRGMSA